MKRLAFAVCLLGLAFSKAEIDPNYQCRELYIYNASTKGEITSPFFYDRERYHNGLWCEYKIIAPEGYRIKLTFKELDISCGEDYLHIRGKERHDIIEHSLCGSIPPYPLFSKDGDSEINLLFRTGLNGTGKGFRIEYESGLNMPNCEPGFTECKNRNCYDSSQRCNGVDDCGDGTDEIGCETGDPIDSSYQCRDLDERDASVKGEVTSPFFYERKRYHDGLYCETKITAPEGHRIKLTFKVMDIACGGDLLVMYSKGKESMLGSFCGSDLPYPVFSKEGENEISMVLHTDFMVSGKGFRIEYESGPNMRTCNPGFTQCTNRNCYDNNKKCDGRDDCGDGTDEQDCGFPLVLEPKECGIPAITPNTFYNNSEGADRMVGGETAIPNSWPWMVSLQTFGSEPNSHFCGGTLLNAQWVLTATHCIAGMSKPEFVKVQIGSHYKYKKTKYEQIRSAIKIIAYPDLEFENMRTFDMMNHDMALIKLNAPVEFNDGVSPACLPEIGWEVEAGWTCYATGWGATRGSGGSDELKQMEQITQITEGCPVKKKEQICVSKPLNSPCHGDSGSPLNCKVGDRWYVFGAASWVATTNMMTGLCAGADAKTVYANAVDKREWIRTIINKYS